MSDKMDRKIADAERQKRKNCHPGNDKVTGLDNLRTQGKGDKLRDADGEWYSDEIKERLNKIFKKDGKKKSS